MTTGVVVADLHGIFLRRTYVHVHYARRRQGDAAEIATVLDRAGAAVFLPTDEGARMGCICQTGVVGKLWYVTDPYPDMIGAEGKNLLVF